MTAPFCQCGTQAGYRHPGACPRPYFGDAPEQVRRWWTDWLRGQMRWVRREFIRQLAIPSLRCALAAEARGEYPWPDMDQATRELREAAARGTEFALRAEKHGVPDAEVDRAFRLARHGWRAYEMTRRAIGAMAQAREQLEDA